MLMNVTIQSEITGPYDMNTIYTYSSDLFWLKDNPLPLHVCLGCCMLQNLHDYMKDILGQLHRSTNVNLPAIAFRFDVL